MINALTEDIGSGDISAALLNDKPAVAVIISRENAVFCGLEYADAAFLQIDPHILLDWQVKDGDKISKNQILCNLSGKANSIVSAERTALNFLQMLSAVATQTRFLVEKISHTKTQILDTRKTIPNLRTAQKYAVKCGGGVNHRLGLFDCVLLKENHIKTLGSIKIAAQLATQKYPKLPLIIEVSNLQQLSDILSLTGIKRILCDNFSVQNLKLALEMTKHKIPLEVSGDINADNICQYAETGVEYISIGALTKHISAIDLSLTFT